ncbi:MAG: hypothetical protein FJ272_16225, partial [Planctomycetes bacterium]|nr:hypothetical protein [Planctomycetota bacterium]
MQKTLAALALLALVATAHAAVSITESKLGDRTAVTLENDYVRMAFQPGKGGECTDLVDKRTGKRLLMAGEGALVGNRVWNYADAELYQQWQKARWEHEVHKAANEVTLVMRAPGQVGFTRSCVFEKRVTLRDGEALARVEHVFHVGQELMVPQQIGLWFYNRCGVPNERNTYFMPLDEGVASVDAASGIGQTWQYTPSRGWLAFVSESGNGLCFGMEYRRLMCFYLCAGRQPTFEWAFRTFEVKNGDSFRTEEII